MENKIQIRTSELQLILELAKAALKLEAHFHLTVGKYKCKYGYSKDASALTIGDICINADREEMSLIFAGLMGLCKHPVDKEAVFITHRHFKSKSCYKFTFKSWLKAVHPVIPSGTHIGTELIPPSILIPTVYLSVEEIDHGEDSESDKKD